MGGDGIRPFKFNRTDKMLLVIIIGYIGFMCYTIWGHTFLKLLTNIF